MIEGNFTHSYGNNSIFVWQPLIRKLPSKHCAHAKQEQHESYHASPADFRMVADFQCGILPMQVRTLGRFLPRSCWHAKTPPPPPPSYPVNREERKEAERKCGSMRVLGKPRRVVGLCCTALLACVHDAVYDRDLSTVRTWHNYAETLTIVSPPPTSECLIW